MQTMLVLLIVFFIANVYFHLDSCLCFNYILDTPPSFPNGCPDAIEIQLNTTASRTIEVSDYISQAESGKPSGPNLFFSYMLLPFCEMGNFMDCT